MTEAGSGVIIRWAVLHEHTVSDDDLDPPGRVSDDAVERWANAARSAYLGRCRVALEPLNLRHGLRLIMDSIHTPVQARSARLRLQGSDEQEVR